MAIATKTDFYKSKIKKTINQYGTEESKKELRFLIKRASKNIEFADIISKNLSFDIVDNLIKSSEKEHQVPLFEQLIVISYSLGNWSDFDKLYSNYQNSLGNKETLLLKMQSDIQLGHINLTDDVIIDKDKFAKLINSSYKNTVIDKQTLQKLYIFASTIKSTSSVLFKYLDNFEEKLSSQYNNKNSPEKLDEMLEEYISSADQILKVKFLMPKLEESLKNIQAILEKKNIKNNNYVHYLKAKIAFKKGLVNEADKILNQIQDFKFQEFQDKCQHLQSKITITKGGDISEYKATKKIKNWQKKFDLKKRKKVFSAVPSSISEVIASATYTDKLITKEAFISVLDDVYARSNNNDREILHQIAHHILEASHTQNPLKIYLVSKDELASGLFGEIPDNANGAYKNFTNRVLISLEAMIDQDAFSKNIQLREVLKAMMHEFTHATMNYNYANNANPYEQGVSKENELNNVIDKLAKGLIKSVEASIRKSIKDLELDYLEPLIDVEFNKILEINNEKEKFEKLFQFIDSLKEYLSKNDYLIHSTIATVFYLYPKADHHAEIIVRLAENFDIKDLVKKYPFLQSLNDFYKSNIEDFKANRETNLKLNEYIANQRTAALHATWESIRSTGKNFVDIFYENEDLNKYQKEEGKKLQQDNPETYYQLMKFLVGKTKNRKLKIKYLNEAYETFNNLEDSKEILRLSEIYLRNTSEADLKISKIIKKHSSNMLDDKQQKKFEALDNNSSNKMNYAIGVGVGLTVILGAAKYLSESNRLESIGEFVLSNHNSILAAASLTAIIAIAIYSCLPDSNISKPEIGKNTDIGLNT